MKSASKVSLLPRRTSKSEVEVTPGQVTVPIPPNSIARIAIYEVIPTGEAGVYRHQARVHSAELEVTTAVLRKLGIGIGTRSLKRLIKAGFVKGSNPSPQRHVFSLESYFDHCDRVRAAMEKGENFWTGDNLDRYRTAL